MLAIITRMTLTQVSTWFANARRRLKKESKMDDKDIDLSDIEVDGELCLPFYFTLTLTIPNCVRSFQRHKLKITKT